MVKHTGLRFQPSKIKRIIQSNSQIGKVCVNIAPLVSCSLELFLEDVMGRMANALDKERNSKLSVEHLNQALKEGKHEFLAEFMEGLVEKEAEPPKRKRTKREDSQ